MPTMASNSRQTWKKRTRRHSNAGRKRKNKESRHSTPSEAELFAGINESGKSAAQSAPK
jgi:hypothetical protein